METPLQIISAWTLDQIRVACDQRVVGADDVRRAAEAANSGQLEDADIGFQRGLASAEDLGLLFAGFQFYFRTGNLDKAERLVRRRLDLASREGETTDSARAWTNLGLVLLAKGDRPEAKVALERALEIDERLENEVGIARDLGNLGNLYESAEDAASLDLAEQLYRRSLEIAERIGATEIAAGKIANLGDIAMVRGDRASAVACWTRAVELFTHLNDRKWRAEYESKIAAMSESNDRRQDNPPPIR